MCERARTPASPFACFSIRYSFFSPAGLAIAWDGTNQVSDREGAGTAAGERAGRPFGSFFSNVAKVFADWILTRCRNLPSKQVSDREVGWGPRQESEGEEAAEARVTLPQDMGRGNLAARQSRIRLHEVRG